MLNHCLGGQGRIHGEMIRFIADLARGVDLVPYLQEAGFARMNSPLMCIATNIQCLIHRPTSERMREGARWMWARKCPVGSGSNYHNYVSPYNICFLDQLYLETYGYMNIQGERKVIIHFLNSYKTYKIYLYLNKKCPKINSSQKEALRKKSPSVTAQLGQSMNAGIDLYR